MRFPRIVQRLEVSRAEDQSSRYLGMRFKVIFPMIALYMCISTQKRSKAPPTSQTLVHIGHNTTQLVR